MDIVRRNRDQLLFFFLSLLSPAVKKWSQTSKSVSHQFSCAGILFAHFLCRCMHFDKTHKISDRNYLDNQIAKLCISLNEIVASCVFTSSSHNLNVGQNLFDRKSFRRKIISFEFVLQSNKETLNVFKWIFQLNSFATNHRFVHFYRLTVRFLSSLDTR